MQLRVVLLAAGLLSIAPSLQPQSTAPTERVARFIQQAKDRLGDRLATTAEEIIARHVEAVGGREAIASIRTMKIVGRNLILSEQSRPLVRHYRAPAELLQTIPGSATSVYSDGKSVYSIDSATRAEMKQPWTAALRHERIDGDFLDYRDRGIACEYIGLEAFATEPTVFYHVKRTFPDGYTDDLFFDVDSGLLRLTRENGDLASQRAFYEYRDVGSIRLPHLRLTVFDGMTPPHLFVVDSVEVNGPLPDNFPE